MIRNEAEVKTGGGNALREVQKRYASLLDACEFGSESGAVEVMKIIAERDALRSASGLELVARLEKIEKYLTAVCADDDLELDPAFVRDDIRELLRDLKGGSR